MISRANKVGLVAVPLAMLAALLLSSRDAAAQTKPSFDCAKAASVAEKAICADPDLAQADADVAKTYAAALKLLDARAGKALRDDQGDFIQYRDQIADFNKDTLKNKQTVDLGEFMRDRATFLSAIRKPSVAGLIGTWSSMRGTVEIKAKSAVRLEISEEVADPVSGNESCEISGTVKVRNELRLVDTDDNNKPTGFSFTFRHSGDALVVEQSGEGKNGLTEPPTCGANGHADGTFFLTEQK